jgi:hypothetical protein
VTATEYGCSPARRTVLTRDLAVSITHSVPATGFVTYSVLPSGLSATFCGPSGAGIRWTTRRDSVETKAMLLSVVM